MKQMTPQELESFINEEIDNMDEGLWDKIKGVAGGAMSALTSPLGSIGQGYQRGKASSALKSASTDLMGVRDEFIDNIEGLFKAPFADVIKLKPELADVANKWNMATDKIEEASKELEMLSMEVKMLSRTPSRQARVQVGPSQGSLRQNLRQRRLSRGNQDTSPEPAAPQE